MSPSFFARRIGAHFIAVVPAIYFTVQLLRQPFYADIGEQIIHFSGLTALQLLLATLSISLIAKYSAYPIIIRWRRPLGLWSFFYALLHFMGFFIFEAGLDWREVWQSILEFRYLYFGILALLILLVLAVTSNKYSITRLKKRWHKLHRLVYVAIVSVIVHFFLLVKSQYLEVFIYATITVVLLGFKFISNKR